MADRDTLAILAGELAFAFQPLAAALRSQAAYRDLLEDLGWNFETVPAELDALRQPVTDVMNLIANGTVGAGDIPLLLGAVKTAFVAISDLGGPSPLAQEFRDQFPRQLVDYLVVEYLLNRQPRWGFLFMALGILSVEGVSAQPGRSPYIKRSFAFEDLDDLVTDPLGYLKTSYQWNTSNFDGDRLAVSLVGLLQAWSLPIKEQRVDEQTRGSLQAGALSPDDAPDISPQLVLFEDSTDPDLFNTGVGLYLLPETAADRPGFAILPFASSEVGTDIAITPNITLSFETAVDLTSAIGFFIRPNRDVQFLGGLDSGAPSPLAGELKAVMTLGTPNEPILIFGSPDASRFEFGGISTTAGLRLRGVLEVFAELALQAGKIVIKPASGEGDSFLSKVLPSNLEIDFGLMVGFSTTKGIYFGSSAKLEVVLPVNLELGPVEIASASAAIGPKDGAIAVDVAATASVDFFSVVTATVQDIGVSAKLTFPDDRKGNLGPINLGLGFKAPTGIGLFIESSSVSGGGFLFLDQPNGRYGGAVELRAYDIDIKAFGLIETKVPGVSFSFVIVISAEFNPIQLGFGFTLDGVGGLIGINRTIDSNVVAARLRDGTLDNVLFPTNLIQNAPAIISELGALFPAADAHYVFGPMAKLGWSGLVHGTIGIILELPSKALTIVGNVNAILPKPDNAIVVIDMDIAGKLDFPKKHFELDATLSPASKLGAYTISGDMATRIDWGDRPNFAISLGGFHSQYTPPPGFPSLRPLAINLGIKGNPDVTLQGFMALTSNTAQVGARLDIYASFGATLTGNVGFEALFVFSPFSFDARLWGGVHVDFLGVGFGMTLDGRIRGPSPWKIDGEVCVSLWFDSACVGIHKELGGAPAPQTLPLLDPWEGFPVGAALSAQEVPGLKPAIADSRNWSARLPAGALIGVSYVDRKDKKQLVDPVGIATLRQKSLPFDYDISRYAGRAPSRPGKLFLAANGVTAGGKPATAAYVTDYFAPGQYQKMSNDQALAAQPFEQLKAGFDLQGSAVGIGSARNRPVTYRTHVLDTQGNEVQAFDHDLPTRHLDGLSKSTAVARLSARLSGRTRFIDITQARRIVDAIETFSLTFKADLKVVGTATNVTRSEALAALGAKAGTTPFNRQLYQIVASHLAVAA
jgi:hypothetical protein